MIDFKKLNKKYKLGDTISLKCSIVRPQLTYIDSSIESKIEDMEYNDKYITYFFIDIFFSDLDSDTETKIGVLKGCYITPEDYMTDGIFFEVCDAESQELSVMAESIIGKNWELNEEFVDGSDCIAYISKLFIYEEYRKNGIGSYILNELKSILEYYSRDVITKIILLPEPLVLDNENEIAPVSDEDTNKKELKQNLIEFYKKNGFDEINDSGYMIKDVCFEEIYNNFISNKES